MYAYSMGPKLGVDSSSKMEDGELDESLYNDGGGERMFDCVLDVDCLREVCAWFSVVAHAKEAS